MATLYARRRRSWTQASEHDSLGLRRPCLQWHADFELRSRIRRALSQDFCVVSWRGARCWLLSPSLSFYHVTLEPPRCTCADARERNMPCKHVLHVALVLLRIPPEHAAHYEDFVASCRTAPLPAFVQCAMPHDLLQLVVSYVHGRDLTSA